jgi:hypothetical protein
MGGLRYNYAYYSYYFFSGLFGHFGHSTFAGFFSKEEILLCGV